MTHEDILRKATAVLVVERIEIMYPTAVSVRADLLESASVKEALRAAPQQTIRYVEVGALEPIEAGLAGERRVMPRRTTFYGSTELGDTDPAGNIIVFARRPGHPPA